MTEMDITFIFIRYISVTIKRQARAFDRRYNKIIYYENKEFVESIEIENELTELSLSPSSSFYRNIEEILIYQELLLNSLNSTDDMGKRIIYEKFIERRSDADIGKDLSVSSQMISKRKRKILNELKTFF